MKPAGLTALAILLGMTVCPAVSMAAGFQKIAPHVFYLESKSTGHNTGLIVTPDGVLLVDPPPESEIAGFLTAMKGVTPRPVRWAVSTDYAQANSSAFNGLLKQGASVLLGKDLDRLAASIPPADPGQPPSARPTPRILFGRQLQIYPGAIEIRMLALKGKARTAGDVVVYFPSEKVLFVGGFFVPSGFPLIDSSPGEGTALGWIDALKQVIEFAPILKSAMPQPKQEPGQTPPVKPAEPEKSPEELMVVVTAQGVPTNLQDMKDVYAVAQKLKVLAARAVSAVRSREEFLKTLTAETFSGFGNLESFAGQLFEDLSRK
jgi:glyoxylase-like metal-dependent hydrolase (beta-lactamase superfamily II)